MSSIETNQQDGCRCVCVCKDFYFKEMTCAIMEDDLEQTQETLQSNSSLNAGRL